MYDNGPGPAASVNVSVYANGAGNLPGTLLASRPNQSFTGGPSFVVTLSPSIGLLPGTYWLSVQADQNFASAGQWFWTNRTVQSNSGAAWQNPGGGQGGACPAWERRTTCLGDVSAADQVFRITGTVGPPPPPPPPRLRLHRLRLRLRRRLRRRHRLGHRTTTSSTQSSSRGAERSAARPSRRR